jgi:hypothetical protein
MVNSPIIGTSANRGLLIKLVLIVASLARFGDLIMGATKKSGHSHQDKYIQVQLT